MTGTRVPERRRTDTEWSHALHTHVRTRRGAGRTRLAALRLTHSSAVAVETGVAATRRATRQRAAATRRAARRAAPGAAERRRSAAAVLCPGFRDRTIDRPCSGRTAQSPRSTATVLHAAAAVRRAAGTVLRTGAAARRAAGAVLRTVPRPGGQQQQVYTQRAVTRPGPAPGAYDNNRGYDNGGGYGNRAPAYGYNNAYGYRGDPGRRAYVSPRGGYG